MPYVETLDDILNQYADWFGVYGACKCEEVEEGAARPCDSNPKCCRVGFMIEQSARIRQAMQNEMVLHSMEAMLEKLNAHPQSVEFWIYEQDLPEMTPEVYAEWFKKSRVIGGVRMGPPVK